MRVLLVTGSYPPMRCGVGDYVQQLACALKRAGGGEVAVLTSVSADATTDSHSVRVFPVIDRWSPSRLLTVFRVFKDWTPDIVHVQHPAQGYGGRSLPWLVACLAFLMKKKVFQTWHEGFSRRDAPLVLIQALISRTLIFVRPRYTDRLHTQMQWILRGRRTEYIPNASAIPGADLDESRRVALRQRYLAGQQRLIVFFGYLYKHKGLELLFEICDSNRDRIVIAGQFPEGDPYSEEMQQLASSEEWRGKVDFVGFLPVEVVGQLLAAADAVVLPFKNGGGEWNTSIHAAVLSRSLVITTSLTKHGFDENLNIYFARVNGVQEMKEALDRYEGKRRNFSPEIDRDEWMDVAAKHWSIYKSM